MTATTATPIVDRTAAATAATVPTTARRVPLGPIVRRGLVAAAGAAILVTALAAACTAAGLDFVDRDGVAIPLLGFAQGTIVTTLAGTALAALLARRSSAPRRTFVRATIALTALAAVPPALFGMSTADVVALEVLHLVAAAIVIPALADRLPR